MTELWQLYDNQGRPIEGQGATKDDVFGDGLLHGASHVWIWKVENGLPEILFQKRAANKRTWANRYDISAAGHIDLGETPLVAALREAKEEIGLDIDEAMLTLIAVHRAYMVAEGGAIENEFQWLYLLKLNGEMQFNLAEAEVASLEWKSIPDFKIETNQKPDEYVPHGRLYYDTVVTAIERQVASNG